MAGNDAQQGRRSEIVRGSVATLKGVDCTIIGSKKGASGRLDRSNMEAAGEVADRTVRGVGQERRDLPRSKAP